MPLKNKFTTLFKTTFFIVIITIILLEIVIRIIFLFPSDTPLYFQDVDIGYRMRPEIQVGGIKTNSFGFKDIEHDRIKSKDVKRIAVIGDSFVFGAVPYLNNFTTVLQDIGNETTEKIEILNMGINAAQPENYLRLINTDAKLMNVDIICIVFFVGNDIVQSHPDFTTSLVLGSTRETLRKPYLIGFSKEYSYLYRTLRSIPRQIRERIIGFKNGSISKQTFFSIEYQRSIIYKKTQDDYIRDSYSGTIRVLKQIADNAKLNNMQIFIVIAPDEIQVNDKLKKNVAASYKLNLDKYDFSFPQKFLSQALKEINVPVLDLLPSFIEQGSNVQLYIAQDSHWNIAGNKLVANEIWNYLKLNF